MSEDITPDDVAANCTAVRATVPDGRMLVAVSKIKPVELMMGAYSVGQRDFGENYVQEFVEKGPNLPEDVRLHFIGHLQTNKVKQLLSEPRLACVHTVDSIKLATELQKRAAQLRPERPLDVMAQVNTSAEESKGGCNPDECSELCLAIKQNCPALRLIGLMCIGKYSAAEGGSAEDFECLLRCREAAAAALGMEATSLSLSMGMSHDYKDALAAGATHVRVGSTIFGARPKKAMPTSEPPAVDTLSIADTAAASQAAGS